MEEIAIVESVLVRKQNAILKLTKNNAVKGKLLWFLSSAMNAQTASLKTFPLMRSFFIITVNE